MEETGSTDVSGTNIFIENLLTLGATLRPPDSSEPDLEQLVRYAGNAVSASQADAIVIWQNNSGEARSRMRALRRTLKMLQQTPLAEVAQRAGGQDEEAKIAHLWLSLLPQSQAAAPQFQDWTELRQRARLGISQAQRAWAMFQAFGQQLKVQLQGRPDYAWARAAEDTPVQVEGDLPEGVTVEADARIETGGRLEASAVLLEDGEPYTQLSGRAIHLSLHLGEELWPLASTMWEGNRAEWHLPDIGTELGLPETTLPLNLLQIRIESTPLPRLERLWLDAEIVAKNGNAQEMPSQRLELLERPFAEAGRFHITFRWQTPFPTTPDSRLLLDVLVSTQRWQRLGEWPLGDTNEAPITLTAACPGIRDRLLFAASELRARLQNIPD